MWIKKVLAAVCLTGLLPTVWASHVFSTNITVEGAQIASGSAFTNPTITVNSGDTIDFTFDLFGGADTFSVSFTGASFLVNQLFAYDGTGTQANPFDFDFGLTAGAPGTYLVSMTPDLFSSFPDYLFPSGNQASEPIIPFTLVVQSNAVPEPASLALVSGALLTMVAVRRRRRS